MGVILKNLKQLKKLLQCCSESSTEFDISNFGILNANGTVVSSLWFDSTSAQPLARVYPNVVITSYNKLNCSSTYTKLGFGTGTTPATEDDYKLESIITEGINFSAFSGDLISQPILEDDAMNAKTRTTLVYENTSGSTLTISEIGFFGGIGYKYADTASYPILLHREVLAEPLVVEAGGHFSVALDAEFKSTWA